LIADSVKGGDEPSVIGPSHRCRSHRDTAQAARPAGTLARRVSKLRRYAPSAMFDQQIRKTNQLAGQPGDCGYSMRPRRRQGHR
jgi:hypothetical protein